MRGVEQGFGGYAAAVQANSAEPLIALDEQNFLAKIGRIKSSRVTTWPRAHDYDFSFDRFHVLCRFS
jgi:hypothetical protein